MHDCSCCNAQRNKTPQVSKFAAVKTVVFATYYQSILIRCVPDMTTELAERWSDFILCVEMIVFSMLLGCAFSADPYDLGGLPLGSDVADLALGVREGGGGSTPRCLNE